MNGRHPPVALLLALYAVTTLGHPSEVRSQEPVYLGSWPTEGLPLGLATSADGRVYVSDERLHVALLVFAQSGTPMTTFVAGAGFLGCGVAVLSDQAIAVSDYYGRRVQRFTHGGVLANEWPTGGQRAAFVAVDGSDNVYVTDDEGNAVRKFSTSGVLLAEWPVNHPSGVACAGGSVYVAEMFGGLVRVYTPDGEPQGSFATGCTWAEQLHYGGDGRLYLADHGLRQLKCFDLQGQLLWLIGPSLPGYGFGQVDYFSVAVAQDGTIFAGDFAHRRVLAFGPPTPTPAARHSFGALKARYRGDRGDAAGVR